MKLVGEPVYARGIDLVEGIVAMLGEGHGFSPLGESATLRASTCTTLAFLRDRLR